MRELPPDTYDTPENILMECVRMLRCRARLRANRLVSGKLFPGAGEGIRTPDPLITNQMLYRLSYASNGKYGPSDTILPCSLPLVRDNYRKYHNG
jgi:hypothetical protein